MKQIYYKTTVFWPAPEGQFILGINMPNNTIYYYEDDLNQPIAQINLNNPETKLPNLDNFYITATATAMYRAYKCIKNNDFPEQIEHANCAVYIIMDKLNNDSI